MKKMILGLAAAVGLAFNAQAAENYTLDPSHSAVMFKLSHLGFSAALGQFRKIEGQASADWSNPATSSVSVTIDVNSVDTNWPERDQYLMSDAFFDAANHGTISFVSKTIDVTGENTAKITGDLTMRGVTKPVTLDARLNQRGENPFTKMQTFGISASTSVKRSDFGVSGFIPAVADDVEIHIEAEFVQPTN